MKRIALASILLLAAILSAAWILYEAADAGDPAVEPAARRQPAEPTSTPLIPTQLLTAEGARESVDGTPVELDELPTAIPGVAVKAQTFGTLLVTDIAGIEHPNEDGTLTLVWWSGTTGEYETVPVKAGRWSTQPPADPRVDGFSVEGAVLRGRAAAPEGPDDRIPVAAGIACDLRARWPLESLLHVRDRATSRELDRIQLVLEPDWNYLNHPGVSAKSASECGASPVRIPEAMGRLSTRSIHARSPGYAWGKVEIDDSLGGERTLWLDPGGDLEITVSGVISDPGLRLYIHQFFDAPLLDVGTQRIEGLQAGTYEVRAQIGPSYTDPLVIARTSAEIAAGGTTRIALEVPASPPLILVPLSGTFVLPEEWMLPGFRMEFELLDTELGGWNGRFRVEDSAMKQIGTRPATYSWSAPDVQPGRYEVAIQSIAFSRALEVGPAGSRDARIEVPPPARVLVRCVDDASGLDAVVQSVSWRTRAPEGGKSSIADDAIWNAELARWEFRAAVGEIVMGVADMDLDLAQDQYTVRSGTNELVLRVVKLCSFVPLLREGTVDIPWPDDTLAPDLFAAEGQQEYWGYSAGAGSITLLKVEPGLYTLKVPLLDGYAPVPDRVVRLQRGVVTTHVIELQRMR